MSAMVKLGPPPTYRPAGGWQHATVAPAYVMGRLRVASKLVHLVRSVSWSTFNRDLGLIGVWCGTRVFTSRRALLSTAAPTGIGMCGRCISEQERPRLVARRRKVNFRVATS